MLANKEILEPVVEQTISLVHEEEFNSLAKELGFLKESCSDDKTDCTSPPKVIFRCQNDFTDPKSRQMRYYCLEVQYTIILTEYPFFGGGVF